MSHQPPLRRLGRFLGLMSAVLAAIGLLAAPAIAQPSTGAHKIEAAVSGTLDAKGSADFFVEFAERADLTAASQIEDWTQRGQAVTATLKKTANESQAAVRQVLDAQKVDYQAFWISNRILVKNGSKALADQLTKQVNVSALQAPRTYQVPTPTPGTTEAMVDAVEWGIAAINADDVWPAYGRGEGIVVANIDTGVDYDHPALVGKYRGNTGGGTFDHNYNWADPSDVCGNPSAAPCDNNDHGTHTMGTMVGEDGANQIGVAPGAQWIAAKGCESSSCSEAALLGSAEWIAEPTDLNGENPRADMRPHIVNNSWGGGGGDRWYADAVNAWRAGGIFPAFSNGNSGPSCQTAGSPGDYPESYASGAFDSSGEIADFSSRGAAGDEIKPNLAAPGVNVRSSVDGGGYAAFNGTSMASPHTAGVVALMWSAAPSLVGDLEQTASLLDDTAVDTEDLTCGGTADDNNVWGEGKLDALTAVEQSPRGPVGTLAGTVTSGGTPIAGARVAIEGEVDRTGLTDEDGTYTFPLPVGEYTVTVSAFGYAGDDATVTIAEDATTTQDFDLSAVPSGNVSGVVSNGDGDPVANATVTVDGTPIPSSTTGADGSFSFANVPHGTYTVTASAGGCFGSVTVDLVVDGDETLNITLPQRTDDFGYSCVIEGAGYVEGDTPLALSGDDAAVAVDLPFAFNYYGTSYNRAFVATNGHVNFLASSTAYGNVGLPASGAPNAAIYPFWDDLTMLSGTSQAFTKVTGTAPDRTFVIEWRNAGFYATTGSNIDFQVQLNEDGSVVTSYRNLDAANPRELGNSATVGIENATGTVGLQYSLNSAVLSNDQSIKFLPPPSGVVTGTVTDANDGLPVEGATVKAVQGSTVTATTTTAADGTYSMRLLLGSYAVEASKTNYSTDSESVTLETDDQVVTANFSLATSTAVVGPDTLSFLGNDGQLRTSTVELSNTSTSGVALTYSLTDDSSWLWTVPASGTVAPGASRNLTVRVDASGLEPGVHRGTIVLTTNAGRTPTVEVPVTLVVPAYRQGIDAGSTSAYVDNNDDPWGVDRAWTPGSYGYVGAGYVNSTRQGIAGTDDDRLYQTQREATSGYRFDNLPAGTYVVELEFAELRRNLAPGRRVFDVSINGELEMLRYDPVAAVGTMTADHREFTVTVGEGGSISVDFGAIRGQLPPTINGLRITHRPDLG